MLTKEGAELLQGAVGLSKSEIKSIPSGMAKLFNNMKRSRQTQIVAKVVKAENCYAQVKPGDQLVFDPFLNPEKSTGVMCPRALLPVMAKIEALWEMSVEWAASGKDEFAEIAWRHVRCMDPGLKDGGLGCVVYEFRIEPKTWDPKELAGEKAPEWTPDWKTIGFAG